MKLYKLVLLDDEKNVSRGIQKVFDLPKMGFEIAAIYEEPLKLLEDIESINPDLVITDIKMPKMNGIEFSKAAKSKLPNLEIVIFSGYSDFEFAKEAMKIGISDYILKPVKKKDFTAMIDKMYKKIADKNKENEYYAYLEDFAKDKNEELKNRSFLNLVESKDRLDADINILCEQLGSEVERGSFALARIELVSIPSDKDFAFVVDSIKNDICTSLPESIKVFTFENDESIFFYLGAVTQATQKEARNFLMDFCYNAKKRGCELIPGISEIHAGLGSLFEANTQCNNQIFIAEAKLHNTGVMSKENIELPYSKMEDLFRAIEIGSSENITKALDQIYSEDSKMSSVSMDFYASITYMILLRMFLMQNKYEPDEYFILRGELDLKKIRDEYKSLKENRKMIEERAFMMANLIANKESGLSSHALVKALDYIAEHYMDNLSQQDVAQQCAISKNYLCSLFRKEMGVTFTHYVTGVRISKAKKMLTDTNMKVSEISKAVGFNDYAYFSKIFKENTGETLSGYRKKEKV